MGMFSSHHTCSDQKNIAFALITEEGEIVWISDAAQGQCVSPRGVCVYAGITTQRAGKWLPGKENDSRNHKIAKNRKGKVSIRNHPVHPLSLCGANYPNAIPKWCLTYTYKLKYPPVFHRQSIPVPSLLLRSFPGALVVPPSCNLNLWLFLLLSVSLLVPSIAVSKPDAVLQLRPSAAGSLSSCTFFVYPSIIAFFLAMTE